MALLAGRRARDAAILLPLGAVLLFLPPYVRLFDQPGFLFNIPLLHAYIFVLWLVGIVLTALLARRLSREADEESVASGESPNGAER